MADHGSLVSWGLESCKVIDPAVKVLGFDSAKAFVLEDGYVAWNERSASRWDDAAMTMDGRIYVCGMWLQ